jgi:hypothetical protein
MGKLSGARAGNGLGRSCLKSESSDGEDGKRRYDRGANYEACVSGGRRRLEEPWDKAAEGHTSLQHTMLLTLSINQLVRGFGVARIWIGILIYMADNNGAKCKYRGSEGWG